MSEDFNHYDMVAFMHLSFILNTTRNHAHLLFEGACFRILCHYIMQRLDRDVDDATELVLDNTDNTERREAH